MTLLSLSDDVLLLVFSLFRGREALPACLTCKRVYCLAIARVASSVGCASPAQLRRLCDYYLSSDPFTGVVRAKYIEDLLISATTFRLEPNGTDPTTAVHLIAELLAHAHNIRRLASGFNLFHPVMRAEPKIAHAFSSMQRLAHIRLSKVADGTFDALQRIGNPTRLTLAHLIYDVDPCDGPMTVPPLLAALASFPNLHTVMLRNFRPPYPEHSTPLPLLPSVRYLRLSQPSTAALDVVERCPNLCTLVLSGDIDKSDGVARKGVGPRWCPLRHVMLADPWDGKYVGDRLSTVSLLQVSRSLGVARDDTFSAEAFLELLRSTSPVGLYFGLSSPGGSRRALPSVFWKDFPYAARTVRSLELRVEWSTWSGEHYNQMSRQLLGALRACSDTRFQARTQVPRPKFQQGA